MPLLARPDGIELHWEALGDGPGVLLAGFAYSYPAMFEALAADLARDHRVVQFHLRGTGESSRTGPYDFETDAGDLEAVAREAGGLAATVGFGDGANRTARVAAGHPGLIESLVLSGAPAVGNLAGHGDALSASREVTGAMLQMLSMDFRAGMRSIVDSGNPDSDEEAKRAHLERLIGHCSHESVVGRMTAWTEDNPLPHLRALGDRLLVLHFPGNPWFPESLVEAAREVLPDARFEHVEDGALRRPDLTAGAVRSATGRKPG